MTASDRLDDWIARPDRPMPAEELMGVRVVHAEPGKVEGTQSGPLDPDTVSLGWFGVLADTMSGRGVACALPAGRSLSTVSMHLELVRLPTLDDCDAVTASGRVVSMDEGWALGRLTVRGAQDRPLVVGTVRFALHSEERDTVPAGETYAVDLGHRNGDLTYRLGMEVEHAGDGRAELSWTPRHRHANPYPIVHGGLHASVADAGLSRAVGPELTLLTLDLSFHRPIPINGDPVTVEARTLHRGRRTALAEGTIRAASGKALTSARGTFGRLA